MRLAFEGAAVLVLRCWPREPGDHPSAIHRYLESMRAKTDDALDATFRSSAGQDGKTPSPHLAAYVPSIAWDRSRSSARAIASGCGRRPSAFRRRLSRAPLNADDVVVGRENRGGRGIPRWIIVPSTLDSMGTTRMAGHPRFRRHPRRTPSQLSHVVYAAALAGAVFVHVAGIVWLGVWLFTRFL